jgi:beta-lactamase class A
MGESSWKERLYALRWWVLAALVLSLLFLPVFIEAHPASTSLPAAQAQLEGFVAERNAATEKLKKLEQELSLDERYGVYVEDLETGAWIGVREDALYEARSLAKVFVLVAVLRDIEDGELALEDIFFITPADRDARSGALAKSPPGAGYTVRMLLWHLTAHSDNTAMNALERPLLRDDYLELVRILYLDAVTMSPPHRTSPRSFGKVLCSIYRAEPLERPAADYALALLANTTFTSQLPAGVPANVTVAHKVAMAAPEGIYHDCGIVFAQHPYVLCVMSANTTRAEADRTISSVSRTVYEELGP